MFLWLLFRVYSDRFWHGSNHQEAGRWFRNSRRNTENTETFLSFFPALDPFREKEIFYVKWFSFHSFFLFRFVINKCVSKDGDQVLQKFWFRSSYLSHYYWLGESESFLRGTRSSLDSDDLFIYVFNLYLIPKALLRLYSEGRWFRTSGGDLG